MLFAAFRDDVAGVLMFACAVDDWLPRGRGEWSLVAVGAVLLIAAYHAFLFVGQQHTTAAAVAIVVSLSLVASALGFLLYFDLLERLGAVEINTVSYVAPIVAALVGWLSLGEVVDATTTLGFGFIAVGFVLVKRRAPREEFGHALGRLSSE